MPGQVKSPYRHGLIAIGMNYARGFREQSKDDAGQLKFDEDGLPVFQFNVSMINRPPIRDLLLRIYDILVRDRSILALEQIDAEERSEYWKDTLIHCKDEDRENQMKYCKAYYTMANLITFYDNR